MYLCSLLMSDPVTALCPEPSGTSRCLSATSSSCLRQALEQLNLGRSQSWVWLDLAPGTLKVPDGREENGVSFPAEGQWVTPGFRWELTRYPQPRGSFRAL